MIVIIIKYIMRENPGLHIYYGPTFIFVILYIILKKILFSFRMLGVGVNFFWYETL